MDRNLILGELLYIIANYEKCRCTSSGFWSAKYIKSLRESVVVMEAITRLMEQDQSISENDLLPIIEFVGKEMIHLPEGPDFDSMMQSLSDLCADSATWNDNQRELFELIKKVILECETLLLHRKRGYKERIRQLLQVLHNFPCVFLSNNVSFFKIPIRLMSFESAIEMANTLWE